MTDVAKISKPNCKGNSPIKAAQRKLRDEKMLLMAIKGDSPHDIAKALDVTVQWVYKKLPEVLDAQTKRMGNMVTREIALQLNRLDHHYKLAMDSFEKSRNPTLEIIKKDEGQPDGPPEGGKIKTPKRTVTTTHQQNVGDPRFLTEARAILADRRKILGLDDEETKKIIIASITQNNITVNANPMDGMNMSIEEMEEVAKIMERIGIEPGGKPKALPENADIDVSDAIEADFAESSEPEAETESEDDAITEDADEQSA